MAARAKKRAAYGLLALVAVKVASSAPSPYNISRRRDMLYLTLLDGRAAPNAIAAQLIKAS